MESEPEPFQTSRRNMKFSILLQFTLLQVCTTIGTYGDEKLHTKNLQSRSNDKESYHQLSERHTSAAFGHRSVETKHDASDGVHERVQNRHGVHKPARNRHGDHKTVHIRHGVRHNVEHENRAKQNLLFHTQNRNHEDGSNGSPGYPWNIFGNGNQHSGSESDAIHWFNPGGPIVTVNPIENPDDDNNGSPCDLNIVQILQELLEAVQNGGSARPLGGNILSDFFGGSEPISAIQQAIQNFVPPNLVNNANGQDGQGENGGGGLSLSNGSSGGEETGGGSSEITGTGSTEETTATGESQGGNGVGEGGFSAVDSGDGAEGTGDKGDNTTAESRSVPKVKHDRSLKANNRNVHSKHLEDRSKNKYHEDRFKTKHHEERVRNKYHEYRGHNKHHEERSKNKHRDERLNNKHHEDRTHNKHHEERSKDKHHE